MKKLAIFALILTVIGAVVYFKAPSAENIVKTVVHKYGSQVTGTEVNLGGFRLALTKGEVEISDLTVANPENYSQPHIMSVGRVLVKVNLKSLLDKTIIEEKVEIEKPQITYELLSLTQNNVSQLLENIKQNTASADKKAAAEEKKTDDGKSTGDPVKDGKKVIISDLSVTGGNINLAASLARLPLRFRCRQSKCRTSVKKKAKTAPVSSIPCRPFCKRFSTPPMTPWSKANWST